MLNKEFVLAGKAIFTAHNELTDRRYTFKVNAKDPLESKVRELMVEKGITKEAAEAEIGPTFFVNLLTGPENTSDYTYMGMLDAATGSVRLTKSSKFREDSQPVVAARWTLRQIWTQATLQPHVTIQHAGRCCRCGRLLTTPDSIEQGIGPECLKKAG